MVAVVCEDQASRALYALPSSACRPNSRMWRGAGVNIFDLFWLSSTGGALGQGWAISEWVPGAFEQSLEQLSSARQAGLRYFRFFAAPWGPQKEWWLRNEVQYWQEFDRVWDAIDASGLYAIPSIGMDQWPAVANAFYGVSESENDMALNPWSLSRSLARRYFGTFVARYRTRASLLFYELGNEHNLLLNLPSPWCHARARCFGNDALTSLVADLVGQIRGQDPTRPISSGFSAPRESAWHLENRGQSTRDSREQWKGELQLQHRGVDIWSIHVYPDGCYFHGGCASIVDVIQAASEVAYAAKTVLFVGEYGGAAPLFTGPTASHRAAAASVLSEQVLQAHSGGAFALSALWAWQCYSHRGDMQCVWPGSTRASDGGSAAMVQALQSSNFAMGAISDPPRPPQPPPMPPPPPPPPLPPAWPQPSPSPSQRFSPPPLGRPPSPPLPTLDSCQSWCGAHPASWSVKCTAVASCAGCAACRLVPPPSSMAYDPMPPLPSPFYLRSPPPAVPTLPPPSPPTPAPVILIPSRSSPAPPHAASPHSCAGAEEQPLQDLTCRLSEVEMSLACSCQYVWAATCAKPIAVWKHCV